MIGACCSLICLRALVHRLPLPCTVLEVDKKLLLACGSYSSFSRGGLFGVTCAVAIAVRDGMSRYEPATDGTGAATSVMRTLRIIRIQEDTAGLGACLLREGRRPPWRWRRKAPTTGTAPVGRPPSASACAVSAPVLTKDWRHVRTPRTLEAAGTVLM